MAVARMASLRGTEGLLGHRDTSLQGPLIAPTQAPWPWLTPGAEG